MRVSNVTHVVGSLLAEHGGPSYTVPSLVKGLRAQGVAAKIKTVIPRTDSEKQTENDAYTDYHKVDAFPFAWTLRSSIELAAALRRSGANDQLFHVHGIWLLANIYATSSFVQAINSTPVIVSPRGMLDQGALQYSRTKKFLFWHAFQKSSLSRAAAFHATSERELNDVRRLGFRQPVILVPNGVDMPHHRSNKEDSESSKTVLFLSRIHPKKGLDLLLPAWKKSGLDQTEWKLHIAGTEEGTYLRELKSMSSRLKLNSVKFLGALFGQQKEDAYRTADIFVLPTRAENFGVVVAEALAHGTPVLTTTEAPWGELETKKCGWVSECSIESLAEQLRVATSTSFDQRVAMGKRGSAWMKEAYSWSKIGEDMALGYEALLEGAAAPGVLIRD